SIATRRCRYDVQTGRSSDGRTAPLLAKASRGVGAEDANDEIKQQPNHRDLHRPDEQHDEEPQQSGQNTKSHLEREETEHGEEPDHEHCAEHAANLPNVKSAISAESYAAATPEV